MYNLVVQKDARSNLSVAEAAKDDSSTMRNLTIVSIIFFPGTFVSALFSMSMFDFHADPGKSIVSPKFWIYWVITLPTTLILLFVWYTWMRRDSKIDRRRKGISAAARSPHRASTMKKITGLVKKERTSGMV